jgi:hypothetical protein
MAISNMIPQIWSARILDKLSKQLVFAQAGVVDRSYQSDLAADGSQVHIHSFNDLTINNYVRDAAITYEVLTDSRLTLQITEQKYFAFRVDSVDKAQMRPQIIDAAAARASYQLAELADRFVAGKYVDASAASPDNIIETTQATAANIYGKVVNMAQRMDEGNAPAEGRFLIVPPWVKALMLQDDKFVMQAKPDMVLNGEIARVAGIRILVSNNVVTTGTAPVIHHCIAGVPGAWAYVEQIRDLEALRLQDYMADAVRGLHVYGHKTLVPALLWDLQLNV